MLFTDRTDAGRRLAGALRHLAAQRPVVLGLPRGGVPVASEVARALGAPLDVVLVRKLGVPHHRELGFGAIGEGGVRVISEDIARRSRAGEEALAAVERAEEAELARQARRFRAGRPRTDLHGRTVIIVDDGVATGATAEAACAVVRAMGAARVVLAVPVAPPDTATRLRAAADELVCLSEPPAFSAVGEWYRDFGQTADEEVVALLAPSGEEVAVDAGGGIVLPGDLVLPPRAGAVVVFAHGSGSGRRSPRNRAVAEALNRAGLGTLLLDLLTAEEEAGRDAVFDVGLLAGRLGRATGLLRERTTLPVGCFGASTGAAAALWAAAEPGSPLGAVVSRGGRPDLAAARLGAVRAPTLLVVGGRDTTVLGLNREAQRELRCENRLDVVPGATHLFEEPGALAEVSALAREWFLRYVASGSAWFQETPRSRTAW